MDMQTAQVWLFLGGGLIAASAAAVASIISAWRSGRVEAKAATIEKKVDVVHEATNSRLSRIDQQLASALSEIATLRAVAREAEKTRVALADAAGAVAAAPAKPFEAGLV